MRVSDARTLGRLGLWIFIIVAALLSTYALAAAGPPRDALAPAAGAAVPGPSAVVAASSQGQATVGNVGATPASAADSRVTWGLPSPQVFAPSTASPPAADVPDAGSGAVEWPTPASLYSTTFDGPVVPTPVQVAQAPDVPAVTPPVPDTPEAPVTPPPPPSEPSYQLPVYYHVAIGQPLTPEKDLFKVGGCCGGGGDKSIVSASITPGDDGIQRLLIMPAGTRFEPNDITVKAGYPIEFTVGDGYGCVAHIVFRFAGVDADLTNHGATVNLPALDPGVYTFTCGMNMAYGRIYAE